MSSAFQHRFILTGGPGSGKSTIIDTIIKRGFWCSKEAGRGVIQDQVNIGGDALPWANQTAFADLMLSWEMRSWHEAEGHTQPCFFDRGVPDVVGYLRLSELTIPRHLENAIEKFRYNRIVFIAPPWREIYVQDSERKQSFDVAIATYHAMVKTYRMYDYQLIELPCVSVEERVDFILSRIKPC
ncbi:AAA family ATPase [Citrobacter freundii complex sp. CFNIH9]|uniref:AAA family ATPase n=1 Tax=Citrobacter freundii complex sp. CFNIH9 TaxID=2077149 RepID=UPI000CD16B6B|nr:AAA family ATPase [Citrobacter freundii complex sp. CFNIH9]AUV45695.1 ATPase [Citrobacter freundii complex sp. CFNIH9]MBA7976847.1 AAA family ATPase [Citrobacter freundii]